MVSTSFLAQSDIDTLKKNIPPAGDY